MIKFGSKTGFEVLAVERASGEVIREAEQITRDAAHVAGFQKAAHRAVFDYERRPGFIYVRSRAISSRTNDNFDQFPAPEIKKAWATFVGKPVFVNHHNANHRRARGFIIDAALHEDTNPDGSPDTWVEVLMEVDAVRFPRLAEAVVKGDIARTSMGTDVTHSICTACGNKAVTPADYCIHIPAMKGQKVFRFNAALGKREQILVAEVCYGLGFFENSLLVEPPADPTAFAFGVDADWNTVPIQRAASWVASIVDEQPTMPDISVRRTAALTKQADEDQCPYDASDSLMVGGVYACDNGHLWSPSDPAALAYHSESSPTFGQLQPEPGVPPVLSALDEAEQISTEAFNSGNFLDFLRGGRDPRSQCMDCGATFAYQPQQGRWVCPNGHATHPVSAGTSKWPSSEPSSTYGMHYDPVAASDPGLAHARTGVDWDSLPVVSLPTRSLVASEAVVSKEAIEHFLPIPVPAGYVVEVYRNARGQNVIANGHHRVAKANILGEPTIDCHVYDSADQMAMAAHVHTALGEVKAPAKVDTLRIDRCPVCKDEDGFNGEKCSVCFAPETLVRVRGGYVPIATIEPGDEVLSEDGGWHRVAEVLERDYDGVAYWLRSSMMTSSVLVTSGHPIAAVVGHHQNGGDCSRPARCFSPKSRSAHHLGWVAAQDLKSDSFVRTHWPAASDGFLDRVQVPSHLHGKQRRVDGSLVRGPVEFDLTPEFLWMVGLYIAEGSAGSRSLNFALHQKEVEYLDRLTRLFEGLGYTTRMTTKETSQGAWLVVHSTTLAEWFPLWLGHGCENKRIPSELINLPMEQLKYVWEGVLDGDGTNGENKLGQTSEILALQMSEIALRLGATPTLNVFQKSDRKRVFKVIGTGRGGAVSGHQKKGTWRWGQTMLARLRQIEPTIYAGKVYNLRVEGDPTYVVQNLLVHNCGHVEPPPNFRDPDLDKAKQVDLRQNQNDLNGQDSTQVDENGNPMATTGPGDPAGPGNPADPNNLADTSISSDHDQPEDLQCSNCGEVFSAGESASSNPDDLQVPAEKAPADPADPTADPKSKTPDDPHDLSDLADKSDKDLGLEEADQDPEDAAGDSDIVGSPDEADEDSDTDVTALDPQTGEPVAAKPVQVDPTDPQAKDPSKPTTPPTDPNQPQPADPTQQQPIQQKPDPKQQPVPVDQSQQVDQSGVVQNATPNPATTTPAAQPAQPGPVPDGAPGSPSDPLEDPVITPNMTCPICGEGTLVPMAPVPNTQGQQDVEDQQVVDPNSKSLEGAK